jgi:hypothetical protein
MEKCTRCLKWHEREFLVISTVAIGTVLKKRKVECIKCCKDHSSISRVPLCKRCDEVIEEWQIDYMDGYLRITSLDRETPYFWWS